MAILGLLAIHLCVPQPSGVIAMTEIFEPYIILTAFVAAPFALRRGSRVGTFLVAVLVIAALGRYVPAWISLPRDATAGTLHVAAWNMEAGRRAGERALTGVAGLNADIVSFEELQPEGAASLANDPVTLETWPHQILLPDSGTLGLGLLSRYPIVEQSSIADPPVIRAVLAPPDGPAVTVIVVHPMPGRFRTVAGIPYALDTQRRDDSIGRIRELVDADLAAGRTVIVMGDINTTEREPAYAMLTAGLRDAHLDAGIGPGFSWRPRSLDFLPFGLIRIDYIFASADLAAVSSTLSCNLPSDHCRVDAAFSR